MLKQVMTCEEYGEHFFMTYKFDQICDEMYWEGGVNTDRLFEIMRADAEAEGIVLSDSSEWDYDTFFYNAYQCAEKGLS